MSAVPGPKDLGFSLDRGCNACFQHLCIAFQIQILIRSFGRTKPLFKPVYCHKPDFLSPPLLHAQEGFVVIVLFCVCDLLLFFKREKEYDVG